MKAGGADAPPASDSMVVNVPIGSESQGEYYPSGVVEPSGRTTSYAYDAWGNLTGHAGDTGQPYQYVGRLGYYTHYQIPSFNLLELGYRFYDAKTGRFTQLDPIGDWINWYAYAGGNPLAWVDPWGLRFWWDWLADIGEKVPILGRWFYEWGYAQGQCDKGAWSPAWLLYGLVLMLNISAWTMGRRIELRRDRAFQ